MHRERRRDIGEQHQRHELQHRRIAAIGDEHLQERRCCRENQRVFVVEAADHERQGFAHRRDVGGDVEGVGRDQQRDEDEHDRARRDLHHVCGEALAGDASDLGTDQLDRDHERGREENGPQQPVAKLRAGLGVGRNARRVIVGRAGDKPGPEQAEHHAAGPLLAPVLRFRCGRRFGHGVWQSHSPERVPFEPSGVGVVRSGWISLRSRPGSARAWSRSASAEFRRAAAIAARSDGPSFRADGEFRARP